MEEIGRRRNEIRHVSSRSQGGCRMRDGKPDVFADEETLKLDTPRVESSGGRKGACGRYSNAGCSRVSLQSGSNKLLAADNDHKPDRGRDCPTGALSRVPGGRGWVWVVSCGCRECSVLGLQFACLLIIKARAVETKGKTASSSVRHLSGMQLLGVEIELSVCSQSHKIARRFAARLRQMQKLLSSLERQLAERSQKGPGVSRWSRRRDKKAGRQV
ncbi:hypothetical protein V8C26DRAFT_410698 [Trichoderma gracile]